MPDQLSALYSDLLEGSCDCVDRIVLNAYFGMGQTGGGFRAWWRQLNGSDENLDDNHLMRMAGRFSRRLRAWAEANKAPAAYASPGERKHGMAPEYLSARELKPGLFMILVSKAPALVWEAHMTGTGKLGQLGPKDPRPYVNHYSFHMLDPDWGHLTIKMSGHPPFGAQVMLNGHEYVACQAQKAGIGFTKQDHCFTMVNNAADLERVADALSQDEAAGRLRQLCERWIYTACLCFALDLDEQEKSAFHYQYSVCQVECGRNLLFRSAHDGRGSPGIDRIELADAWTWGVVVETPTYDLTVFKVHYGKMALKIHNRGERALRIEAIAHNTKAYRWGRSLPCFPEIAARLAGILERFLDAVGCMGACFVSDDTLEKLPAPARIGRTGVGGIDLNKLRMRRVAEAALALSTSPDGFTASDLVQKVGALPGPSEAEHGPRRAAYDVKKLRAKSMVRKIGKSRRHEPVPEGLRSLTALLVLRDKVVKPLLAASNQPGLTTGPNHPTAADHRYEALRTEMRGLFTELGIAA